MDEIESLMLNLIKRHNIYVTHQVRMSIAQSLYRTFFIWGREHHKDARRISLLRQP